MIRTEVTAMANRLDYLYAHGTQSFSELPPNDVDAAILARLAYLPYETVFTPAAGSLTLGSTAEALLAQKERPLPENDQKLLHLLPQSKRWAGLPLFAYENHTDTESQTQFAAICFRLKPGLTCIAFRGTDNTLVGWKEDFNMTFVCPVPAQTLAQSYLERRAAELDGAFLLAGHSKGGNLAVYAAAFCKPEIRSRVGRVFNFDGPGFGETVLQSEGYRSICGRVRTLVPQSSIVGMMLGHEEEYTIVHSSQRGGIFQHNLYSWETDGAGFRMLESVNDSSRFVDFTLKAFLADMDAAQRERFVDTVFGVMEQTNASTLQELGEKPLITGLLMLRAAKQLDDESRFAVTKAIQLLLRSTKIGFLQMIVNRNAPSCHSERSEESVSPMSF